MGGWRGEEMREGGMGIERLKGSASGQPPLSIMGHVGLGDQIIINGLVRHYVEKNREGGVVVVARTDDVESVGWMYRDDGRIEVMGEEDYWARVNLRGVKYRRLEIGYNGPGEFETKGIEEWYYGQVNMRVEERWRKFYYLRDERMEVKREEVGLVEGERYIFVHRKSADGHELDGGRLPGGMRVVEPRRTRHWNNIWCWVGLVEGAEQVHVVDSAFLNMIDSVELSGDWGRGRLVWHQYARVSPRPGVRKEWRVI